MPEPILIDGVACPCPPGRVRTRADWEAAILAALAPRPGDQGRLRLVRLRDHARIADQAVRWAARGLAKAGRVVIVRRPAQGMRYGVPKTMPVLFAMLAGAVDEVA